jgi:hypothetical protein
VTGFSVLPRLDGPRDATDWVLAALNAPTHTPPQPAGTPLDKDYGLTRSIWCRLPRRSNKAAVH